MKRRRKNKVPQKPKPCKKKICISNISIERVDNDDGYDDDIQDITEEEEAKQRQKAKRSSIIYTNRGKQSFKSENYGFAILLFKQSIENGSTNYENYYYISQAEYFLNNLDDSCVAAKKAIDYGPPGANQIAYKLHMWMLEVKLSMGSLKFCKNMFEKINDMFKSYAEGDSKFQGFQSRYDELCEYIEIIENSQDLEKIVKQCDKALKCAEKSVQLHLTRARSFIQMENYLEARSSCVKALNYELDCPYAKYYQFKSLYCSGCFAESKVVLADFKKSTKDCDVNFQLLLQGVEALLKERKAIETHQELKNPSALRDSLLNCRKIIASYFLLENNKFEAEVCLKLAAICKGDNNLEALEYCQKAIELNNKYTRAFIMKGDIEWDEEMYLEAHDCYKAAFTLDNYNPSVNDRLICCAHVNEYPNYYKILGVKSQATPRQIRAAYKVCALKFHPDKYHGSSSEELEKLEQDFKNVNEAYNFLTDPSKKENYDDCRNEFVTLLSDHWDLWKFLRNL